MASINFCCRSKSVWCVAYSYLGQYPHITLAMTYTGISYGMIIGLPNLSCIDWRSEADYELVLSSTVPSFRDDPRFLTTFSL